MEKNLSLASVTMRWLRNWNTFDSTSQAGACESGKVKARKKMLLLSILIVFVGCSAFATADIACAASLGFAGAPLPEVTDGFQQKSIEIMGILAGGNFKDIRISANWADKQRTVQSPPLQIDGTNFRYSFPSGGENCGLVVFSISAMNKGVRFDSSEKRSTHVDCEPPRVLVGNPIDGQVVKAGGRVPVQLRLEDDLLNYTGYAGGLAHYRLTIDVNGQPVLSPTFNSGQPVVNTFDIPIPAGGRHGIRVSFTDRTGKSDEKTVWVNADGTPPDVRIISPTEGQFVSIAGGSLPAINVTVEASDPGSIAATIDRVEFNVDGGGVAVARTSLGGNRYVGTFGVTAGQKTIKVRAFDKVGNFAEASVKVIVSIEGKAAPAGPLSAPPRKLPK